MSMLYQLHCTSLGAADAFCRGDEAERGKYHSALNQMNFAQQPVSSVAYCAGHLGWGLARDDPGSVARECYGLFRQLPHMWPEMRREYDALLRLGSPPAIDPSEDGPLGPLWTVATRVTGPISIWNDVMTDYMRMMSRIAAVRKATPAVLLQALFEPGQRTDDGILIEAVGPAWFEIVRILNEDPDLVYQLPHHKWEEMIAASYEVAGFDDVTLTPRSGDKGRDVIAVKRGLFTIRIIDQVKAYKPGHLVTADEVRALMGVLGSERGVSKGILTTTSDFAPKLLDDDLIRPLVPDRLQLFNGDELLDRLKRIADGDPHVL